MSRLTAHHLHACSLIVHVLFLRLPESAPFSPSKPSRNLKFPPVGDPVTAVFLYLMTALHYARVSPLYSILLGEGGRVMRCLSFSGGHQVDSGPTLEICVQQ